MGGITLKVENLNFNFGPAEVLKDLSFVIEGGTFLSIVGPNGSGKTTLLRNLCAALMPRSGRVLLEKENIFIIKPQKLARQMAVVPQETNITFDFTVYETVLMGRLPHLKRFASEGSRDKAIAKWAMEITNTWHLKDRLVTEISGGERQRVIVARALTQEPKVILLDEPVAHLDLQYQMELLELLQDLKASQNLTIVAVLHDLNLAAQFSDHVVLMKEGRIYTAGTPQEVLSAENIERVYNMEVVIIPNELTGRFNILPVARSVPALKGSKGINIHLVCGGGTGAMVMEKLVGIGYNVSCGVLNIGDGDWNKAKALGIKTADEAPFSPISERAARENEALIEKAEVVILMPLPFGRGNLINLKQVYRALKRGKKVIVVDGNNVDERDFTEGKAKALYKDIINSGALLVNEAKDIFQALDNIGE